jgi:glycosyltransferase involved in cell wall biosynthesis
MKKKVLIVSYYWPPSGGGGVQRWLKMTRYLHEAGWEPIVYTPENPSFDVKDPSLEKYIRPGLQIIRRPIFEPIEIFFSLFKLTGKKKPEQKDFLANRNKSLFQRLSTWIRGNVLLPDPRVMWVRPSVRYLNQWMKTDDIQAIITTGPPHSMHLIGRQLKKKHPRLIWIADFRDPWSEWDLWPMLQTGPRAMSRIRAMERNVLREASAVVSISKYHVDRLSELGGIQAVLIPNGYDHADFAKAQKLRSPQFVIRHMGSVDDLRDPRPFMKALELTIAKEPGLAMDLRMEFFGPVNSLFHAEISSSNQLRPVVYFFDAVPHREVIDLYVSSALLLLILAHTDIAEGNTPGKMYEYMASRTPVIGIGPETGNAALILKQTASGEMIDRLHVEEMSDRLLNYYRRWKNGELLTQPGAEEYSRRALAHRTGRLLDSLIPVS